MFSQLMLSRCQQIMKPYSNINKRRDTNFDAYITVYLNIVLMSSKTLAGGRTKYFISSKVP